MSTSFILIFQGYICRMEEIQRLREFFNSVEIPTGKIQINAWSTTPDLKTTIEAYLYKAEIGSIFYGPAIQALQGIEKLLREKRAD